MAAEAGGGREAGEGDARRPRTEAARRLLSQGGRARAGLPGEPEMLLRARPGLPVRPPLLLLLGPLGPFLAGASAGPVQAEDAAELDFSTEPLLHLVSPAFLSVTIDANLATDPRFLTFLG